MFQQSIKKQKPDQLVSSLNTAFQSIRASFAEKNDSDITSNSGIQELLEKNVTLLDALNLCDKARFEQFKKSCQDIIRLLNQMKQNNESTISSIVNSFYDNFKKTLIPNDKLAIGDDVFIFYQIILFNTVFGALSDEGDNGEVLNALLDLDSEPCLLDVAFSHPTLYVFLHKKIPADEAFSRLMLKDQVESRTELECCFQYFKEDAMESVFFFVFKLILDVSGSGTALFNVNNIASAFFNKDFKATQKVIGFLDTISSKNFSDIMWEPVGHFNDEYDLSLLHHLLLEGDIERLNYVLDFMINPSETVINKNKHRSLLAKIDGGNELEKNILHLLFDATAYESLQYLNTIYDENYDPKDKENKYYFERKEKTITLDYQKQYQKIRIRIIDLLKQFPDLFATLVWDECEVGYPPIMPALFTQGEEPIIALLEIMAETIYPEGRELLIKENHSCCNSIFYREDRGLSNLGKFHPQLLTTCKTSLDKIFEEKSEALSKKWLTLKIKSAYRVQGQLNTNFTSDSYVFNKLEKPKRVLVLDIDDTLISSEDRSLLHQKSFKKLLSDTIQDKNTWLCVVTHSARTRKQTVEILSDMTDQPTQYISDALHCYFEYHMAYNDDYINFLKKLGDKRRYDFNGRDHRKALAVLFMLNNLGVIENPCGQLPKELNVYLLDDDKQVNNDAKKRGFNVFEADPNNASVVEELHQMILDDMLEQQTLKASTSPKQNHRFFRRAKSMNDLLGSSQEQPATFTTERRNSIS